MDRNSVTAARKAIARYDEDFDLMVIYLPGLDHMAHAFGESQGQGERWFREAATGDHTTDSLHGRINRIVRDLGPLLGSTVLAVFSDHGHYDTDPEKTMDLDQNGQFLRDNGFPSWRRTLQLQERFRVGLKYGAGNGAPQIIFVPQFGMAHLYVAGNLSHPSFDWTKPPSLTDLEPLVNSIFRAYITPVKDDWTRRPVADILVRVPAPDAPDRFERSHYMIVPREYDPDKRCGAQLCGLAVQLQELNDPNAPTFVGSAPDAEGRWLFNNAKDRIENWISVNTGDIVLFANGRDGFQFSSKGYNGEHGSLTFADSLVPVAFGFPGATGPANEDTTLEPILQFFSQYGDRVQDIVEARTLERFFEVK